VRAKTREAQCPSLTHAQAASSTTSLMFGKPERLHLSTDSFHQSDGGPEQHSSYEMYSSMCESSNSYKLLDFET
jgi:hypothetical protein